MRTSDLKKLLMENKDKQVSIYSIGSSYNNITIENVSDEMLKASYFNEDSTSRQLYIQLEYIIAVEKI